MANLLRRSLTTRQLHSFAGNQYWGMPLTNWRPNQEGITTDFANLVARAYKGNAVVFACELTRMQLFSEAQFQFRTLRNVRDPGEGRLGRRRKRQLFGTDALTILERPWPGGTTGDLLARMILDADFGNTAFVARTMERRDRLMRMRPDWVSIVLGSNSNPDDPSKEMDADFLGVLYYRGGVGQDSEPTPLLADEVAFWSPIPDPMAAYRGTSWLTPILGEVEADGAASTHKLMFFKNGATTQAVVSFEAGVSETSIQRFQQKLESRHTGVENAYRFLLIGGVKSVTPVGRDFAQLDFKATQGAGETRIAAASGVHPVVAALSEGLQGSSLNSGNFNAARRIVADRTLRPLWRSVCASLASIIDVPPGAELWYDESEISFLQEDRKDAAEIELLKAQTLWQYIQAGSTHDSATAAVDAQDITLLVASGLTSVQLKEPEKPSVNGQTTNGKPAAITVGG